MPPQFPDYMEILDDDGAVASSPPQLQRAGPDPVDKATLGIAFERQRQQIKKIFQDELDKRFSLPPPSGTISSFRNQVRT